MDVSGEPVEICLVGPLRWRGFTKLQENMVVGISYLGIEDIDVCWLDDDDEFTTSYVQAAFRNGVGPRRVARWLIGNTHWRTGSIAYMADVHTGSIAQIGNTH